MPAKQCGIEAFLEMMAAERGAATNTLEAYRRDLDDYESALADAGKSLRNAATDDIRAYLSTLKRRSFAATTTARRLSAIRQLHRFLAAEGHRKDDPAAILEGPRQAQRLPKILSIDEVAKLLDTARAMIEAATEPREKLHSARNFCLLELLYATGLRVSELVALPARAARTISSISCWFRTFSIACSRVSNHSIGTTLRQFPRCCPRLCLGRRARSGN